ncbi:pancreatic lipase-related protein 2-like [Aquarana catesbeiana]|uniref:pancreatic lipase-related protein 2-like n=1 Tax=Aquarana catesbeiana TaxID=8400 RepID=UPI003CC96EA0
MNFKLVLVLSIAAAIRAAQICYDRLGCFTDEPPYFVSLARPISPLPWAPEVINVRFLLYTVKNPNQYQVIRALNVSSLFGTNFKPSRKSIFIIHDLVETGDKLWLVEMCQALLKVSDVNCFCVDWSGGSFALYTQASRNIHVVGAEIAYFLRFVQAVFDYQMHDVYLIGHGLGAHIAGDVGRSQKGIGRISGLDPAGPHFENFPPDLRLDPTDAVFVDAIHTDVSSDVFHLGFGMKQTVGNVDFFPNGGERMPGCDKISLRFEELDNMISELHEKVFCNHQMSVKFFTGSVLKPDGLIGYPASSYSTFQEGSGFPCTKISCAFMGYKADEYLLGHFQDSTSNQIFSLNTGDRSNVLRWRYNISITIMGSKYVLGSLSISLCGTDECSGLYKIYSGLLQSGLTYSSVVDVELDVNPVQSVDFVWHKSIFTILHPKLGASTVTLVYGPSGDVYKFCGDDLTGEDTKQTLEECYVL